MLFEGLAINGAFRVRIEKHADERGFFARTYCRDEFRAQGIEMDVMQVSISYNTLCGTVRGLHMQWPPSSEAKLVRCVRGRIFDVLLDLRPSSPAYLKHEALELDEEDRTAVLIPPGVAHGFQTLSDDAEVLYQMSDVYAPGLQTGVRWNDAAFDIRWPLAASVISDRDASYSDFDRQAFEAELERRQAQADDGKVHEQA